MKKTLAFFLLAGVALAQAPQYPVLPGGGGGGGAVSSVFGRTGAVVAASGDYTATQVTGAMVAPVVIAPTGTPNYNIAVSDLGKMILTTNAPILRFPTAAAAGAGFYFHVYITDTSTFVGFSNTDGALVDGINPAFLNPVSKNGFLFVCDGTNWYSTGYLSMNTAGTSSTTGTNGWVAGAGPGQEDMPWMGGVGGGGGRYWTSTAGRFTGQTAAKTVLTKTTTVATDESYLVSANVLLTAGSSSNFTIRLTYTDESNTSRSFDLPIYTFVGGAETGSIVANLGLGVFSVRPIHIRCKANTTITIATVGTFTTVTYNVEAHIRHIQ